MGYSFGSTLSQGDRDQLTDGLISTGFTSREGLCIEPTQEANRLLSLGDSQIRIASEIRCENPPCLGVFLLVHRLPQGPLAEWQTQGI